jgi:hypothetical protein
MDSTAQASEAHGESMARFSRTSSVRSASTSSGRLKKRAGVKSRSRKGSEVSGAIQGMIGAGFLSIDGPPLADKLLFVVAEISAVTDDRILEKFCRVKRADTSCEQKMRYDYKALALVI